MVYTLNAEIFTTQRIEKVVTECESISVNIEELVVLQFFYQ